jgi:hypothetical protein
VPGARITSTFTLLIFVTVCLLLPVKDKIRYHCESFQEGRGNLT